MKIMCHEIRQKNSEHTYIETRSFDENSLKIYTTTTTTSLNVQQCFTKIYSICGKTFLKIPTCQNLRPFQNVK